MTRCGWCPSGRFFEAAACGTPLMTDGWEGLDAFFDPQHDLRVVQRVQDVEDVLQMPDSDLLAMASRARERTLEEHTGRVRAGQLLTYLDEAYSGRTESIQTEVAQ